MKLNNGSHLSKEDIELLNANGPYSMAIWSSGDVSIGNEEGLKGRSAYFVSQIRKAILSKFSLDEIRNLTILDVGCNDGWVLHALSDLPFAKMVGIEPRQKNIDKGIVVRDLLNLKNSVEYRCGNVESLGEEEFDIVICAGVLYHVESVPTALRQLHSVCRRFLFIESRCLSSKFLTSKLRSQIEMRDLVYQFKSQIFGITAQKFESSYHDGSARETTIVNVPTTESLLMYLEILGFREVKVVADAKTYRAAVWRNKRPLDGVCITAEVDALNKFKKFDEDDWIRNYETGMAQAILPRAVVRSVYKRFVDSSIQAQFSMAGALVNFYILASPWIAGFVARVIPRFIGGVYGQEIVRNLRYSPADKIALEMGKFLEQEGKLEEALEVLRSLVSKINSDWRSVYRSFALMRRICTALGYQEEADHYERLLCVCNPKYLSKS